MLAGARILLTGATGRLGRHLAEELLRGGCRAHAARPCKLAGSGTRPGPRGASGRRAHAAGDRALRRRHRGRARPRCTGAGPAPCIGRRRHPRRSDDELLHATRRGEKRQRRVQRATFWRLPRGRRGSGKGRARQHGVRRREANRPNSRMGPRARPWVPERVPALEVRGGVARPALSRAAPTRGLPTERRPRRERAIGNAVSKRLSLRLRACQEGALAGASG